MIPKQFEFFWKFAMGMVRPQLSQVESERNVPHVFIVSGLCRVGKSTLLAQMAHRLGSDQFYFVNFEDDRFLGFEVDDANDLYQILLILFGDCFCHTTCRCDESLPMWMFFRPTKSLSVCAGYRYQIPKADLRFLE